MFSLYAYLMTQSSMTSALWPNAQTTIHDISRVQLLRAFFTGLLLPLGFAPFHFPGLAILGIALFFLQLKITSSKQSFLLGFVFGLGFLGFGISWVYISIHMYGHLHPLLAAGITLLFITYLALYTGLVTLCYNTLAIHQAPFFCTLLFSSLWCLGEFLRASIFGGFPWLLLGFGQMDSPLSHLLPLIGVYGVSWVTCFSATLLTLTTRTFGVSRILWLVLFIGVLLSPLLLQHKKWTTTHTPALSVGIIQANLSMRDKWDESLFWQLLDHYQHEVMQLIDNTALIVMPESALPLPSSYISDYLDMLDQQAKQTGSSILLGIPQPTRSDESVYYNALLGLGLAEGIYLKQHLVAFGEFTPTFLSSLTHWLALPLPNVKSGRAHQALITVNHHPIATLICYELAFPELLRKQLPSAEWIVSISDDGWFGHSLAVYQHLQMAQVLSKQTGRFQIVSNNDGLSSVINDSGEIINALPAFQSGTLKASLKPSTGASPWVWVGDRPIHLLIISILIMSILRRRRKRPTTI